MPISKAEVGKQDLTDDAEKSLEVIEKTAQSNDNGDKTSHTEVNSSKWLLDILGQLRKTDAIFSSTVANETECILSCIVRQFVRDLILQRIASFKLETRLCKPKDDKKFSLLCQYEKLSREQS